MQLPHIQNTLHVDTSFGGSVHLPKLGPLLRQGAVPAAVARRDEIADAATLEKRLVPDLLKQLLGGPRCMCLAAGALLWENCGRRDVACACEIRTGSASACARVPLALPIPCSSIQPDWLYCASRKASTWW